MYKKKKKSKQVARKKPPRKTNELAPMEVHHRLLQVGKEHYLRVGSKGLSVRQVAQEAGANLGSFVYHFENKENFLEKVIQAHYGDFLQIFTSEFSKLGPQLSPREKLPIILEKMVGMGTKKANLVIRLLLEAMEGEMSLFRALTKEPPLHFVMLSQLIREGQKDGSFRIDMHPNLLLILTMVTVGFPHVLVARLGEFIQNPLAKGFVKEVTGEASLRARIDFALKGMSP